MYNTNTPAPPTVVVVGNYRVGKSSFVKALLGDVNSNLVESNTNQKRKRNRLTNNKLSASPPEASSSSHNESELRMDSSELIVGAQSIEIDGCSVRIVDTAARDVMGTQQQMQSADLVIVLMNAYLVYHEGNDDLDEYWIDQFADISLYSPIIAVFNQMDRLSSDEAQSLRTKLQKPCKEHFVLERIEYASALQRTGIAEVKLSIITVLRSVRDKPRWILIDPYSWRLQDAFECALHRIFRLLDRDSDDVLNLSELQYFNRVCLEEKFTAKQYNLLLRRLTEQNDTFVTLEGLTFNGFRHLMRRFAIAKKWDRCWCVLRFFHCKNDLTLHERVFPSLPPMNGRNISFELTPAVYILLEKLFIKYADDTIIDLECKSIASSMINSNTMHTNETHNVVVNDADSDEMSEDEGKVLSMDGLANLLCVLPSTRPELHCSLLDRHVIDHFETAGRKLNKLTKNGWLSFWAMFAVENAAHCFFQLTYLDVSSDTDRNSWFRVIHNHRVPSKQMLNKSVIRILLFGGPQCGKTVFCDRLLCRIPIEPYHTQYKKKHRPTQHFRAVSNRIGASNEYNFLAITEVPAINQYIEQAMDNFLNSYDMILLQFDLSESRSFYELHKIFDRMPKNHLLPIQVLATKADRNHVEQINLEDLSEGKETQSSYHNMNAVLAAMGAYPPAQTWLTNTDSCDFPQLFDDIFFIATHPHFRRLKTKPQSTVIDDSLLNWKTLIKRTVTITVSVSFVLYSAYKVYKWLKPQGQLQPTHAAHQRRYRR